MRKITLALLLALLGPLLAPVFAQAPPAVPALPDSERRTRYTISNQTGPFDAGFAIYGDGTDYAQWIEVWLNGTKLTPVTNWTLALSSGTLATAARPLTNARVTLTTASTGTLDIVGARRPRRISQFSENRGVAARDLNQALTDIIAQNREVWDLRSRTMLAEPGFSFDQLPVASSRANKFLCFDNAGQLTPCVVPPTVPAGRERLTADRTYYVCPSTGSNSNSGLSTGQGFADRQYAVNYIANNVDLNGHNVTIDASCAGAFTGTYTDNLVLPSYVNLGINNQFTAIIDHTGTTIHPTSGIAVTQSAVTTPWQMKRGTWTNPGGVIFFADAGGFIALNGVTIGAASVPLAASFQGSKIEFLQQLGSTISGSAAVFAQANQGGQILAQAGTITVTGTPAWSTAFADASTGGLVTFTNSTFSGAATGIKYSVDATSNVVGPGGDLTLLPGNTNGLPVFASGSWTPTDASGAGLVFTGVIAKYIVTNGVVHAFGSVTYPATANGNNAALGGLPFTIPGLNYGYAPAAVRTQTPTAVSPLSISGNAGTSTAIFLRAVGNAATNAELTGQGVYFDLVYPLQ